MAPITWKNINAPGLGTATKAVADAGKQAVAAFDPLRKIIEDQQAGRKVAFDEQATLNTEAAISNAPAFKTNEDILNAANALDPAINKEDFISAATSRLTGARADVTAARTEAQYLEDEDTENMSNEVQRGLDLGGNMKTLMAAARENAQPGTDLTKLTSAMNTMIKDKQDAQFASQRLGPRQEREREQFDAQTAIDMAGVDSRHASTIRRAEADVAASKDAINPAFLEEDNNAIIGILSSKVGWSDEEDILPLQKSLAIKAGKAASDKLILAVLSQAERDTTTKEWGDNTIKGDFTLRAQQILGKHLMNLRANGTLESALSAKETERAQLASTRLSQRGSLFTIATQNQPVQPATRETPGAAINAAIVKANTVPTPKSTPKPEIDNTPGAELEANPGTSIYEPESFKQAPPTVKKAVSDIADGMQDVSGILISPLKTVGKLVDKLISKIKKKSNISVIQKETYAGKVETQLKNLKAQYPEASDVELQDLLLNALK